MFLNDFVLLTPGPTPVPDRVKHAMNAPMIGHRGQAFPKLLDEVSHRLMPVFGSPLPVTIISGSGTAALETAASNLIDEGDEVVVVITGAFGERFASICDTFGARVHRLEIEWGKSCHPEQLEKFLKDLARPPKAVFATYCETSTGVLNPINELGKVTKEITDALFIVDGVSCIGAVPVNMKEWGIDVLVSGSQKALMLPPGLGFIASNESARRAMKQCKTKRFYLDLNRYHDSFEKESSTPFTPAISLIFGALEVCSMLEEEGMDGVIHRHLLLKNMLREGLKVLELSLLTSDEDASPTVTAVRTNTTATKGMKKQLEEKYSILLAGGQKRLKGEIFRIGHMGYCTPFDLLKVLSAIEMVKTELEGKKSLGLATAKAQEVWMNHV